MCDEREGDRIKKILNIDEKRLRGSGNTLHATSALSKEDGICFGQKAGKEAMK
jgi:hypothetical protein